MGAYFSKDPNDFQLLARGPDGEMEVYTIKNKNDLLKCNPLPFEMRDNVAYAFISNPADNLHAHVYKDDICDITGNEPVTPGAPFGNKSANTIKRIDISNSNYFSMSNEPVNTPNFGMFIDKKGFPEKAAKSSFRECKLMPMNSMPIRGIKDNISYDHDTVPMVFYTDAKCNNEYISSKPLKKDTPASDYREHNEPNRAVDPKRYVMPYTDVKAVPYADSAAYTNAKYYRSFRPKYPKNIDSLPDDLPPQLPP